jgi:hypothetical protein
MVGLHGYHQRDGRTGCIVEGGEGTMESLVTIPLTRGMVATVDKENLLWLSNYKWHVRPGRYTYYAARWEMNYETGKRFPMTMHRQVLGLWYGDQGMVDHINGNGLDNRVANIRIATVSVNNYNCKVREDNRSGYRGVCWYSKTKKWHAQIGVNGTVLHLGYFDAAQDAAVAYDVAAIKHYGKEAFRNFPDKENGYAQ